MYVNNVGHEMPLYADWKHDAQMAIDRNDDWDCYCVVWRVVTAASVYGEYLTAARCLSVAMNTLLSLIFFCVVSDGP